MELNMKKEIRRELAVLKKNKAKVGKDQFAFNRSLNREKKQIDRDYAKAIRINSRKYAVGNRFANRTLEKINRRIAILEGRLS